METTPQLSVAPISSRIMAAIIDAVLATGVAVIIIFAAHLEFTSIKAGILLTGLALVYEVIATSVWGATIGKQICGMKVTTSRATMSYPNMLQSFNRYAVKTLEPVLSVLSELITPAADAMNFGAVAYYVINLGYAHKDPAKQGVHDKAVGTYVVLITPATATPATFTTNAEAN